MPRVPRYAVLLATIVLAPAAGAQVPSDLAFPCTTPSNEARVAFQEGAWQVQNAHMTKGASLLNAALAADPSLGIARAYLVWATQSSLAPAQRQQELDRAVSDAARGSRGEHLMASTLRAMLLGRTAERDSLIGIMTSVMPGNPEPQVMHAYVSRDPATAITLLEDAAKKWPTYAPAFDQLALARWRNGDLAGALMAAEAYLRLAPELPNPHRRHAQMLQLSGRLPEALKEYQRLQELDPTFGPGAGILGVAEVQSLMGRAKESRESYLKWAELGATPVARLSRRDRAAFTWMLEGKTQTALAELNTLAEEQAKAGLKAGAAGSYRWIALIESMFGDRTAVAPNLARAWQQGGDGPEQWRFTAMTYAMMFELDVARESAKSYRTAAATGTSAMQEASHELDGILAVVENDLDRAANELALAGDATLGRAMLAKALAANRLDPEAEAVKDRIMGTYTMTGFDVLARLKVRKL